MYYTKFYLLDKAIYVAWMDGTHKTVFYSNKSIRTASKPFSLKIDYVEEKLYWIDVFTSTLERINLDGKDHEIILQHQNKTFEPLSFAFHNHYIFWSNKRKSNIYRTYWNSSSLNDTIGYIKIYYIINYLII